MPGRTASGRRAYTNAEKLAFVREFHECVDRGANSALLRRWALHAETGRKWVIAAEEGRLGPAAPMGRVQVTNRDRARLVALERENERLRAKVAAAEAALEIMGKAHELLDGTLKSSHEAPEVPVSLMSPSDYQAWLAKYRIS